MMSWKLFFRIVAIVLFVSGVIGLVAADQYMSTLDVVASVGGRLWGRSMGGLAIGLGVIVWLAFTPRFETTRRPAAIGVLVAFGVTMVVDIVSTVSGDLPAMGWSFVVLNGVIAVFAAVYLRTRSP